MARRRKPVLVAGLFLYVVAWNVAGLQARVVLGPAHHDVDSRVVGRRPLGLPLMFRDYVVERMLGDLGWIGRVAGLHQRWDMFYRTSPEERGWHVVIGTLEDGREISLLEGGRPLEGGTHRKPASVPGLYPTTRWATYFAYLRTPGAEPARRLLPAVISGRWAQAAAGPADRDAAHRLRPGPAAIERGEPEHREILWYEGPAQAHSGHEGSFGARG